MKAWVREKLKQINELYPKERLEKSKARYRSLWAGATPDDRYPFTLIPASFDYYNDVMDKETGLKSYLDEFICRGFVDDDFIPAFFPGCKPSTIPGMFGAKEIVVGGDYSCERILHKPEDIDYLPAPTISPGTPAHDWLEIQKYYQDECEGLIPVHVCDMQGPMDVCGKLFGYENMFICAYEDEERFHKLMDILGDAFQMLWDKQKDLLGENFVGTHLFGWSWIPENSAVTMSIDSLAMISADFFTSYYAPHIKNMAKRYNKLAVHSCGNFSAVIKDLSDIPKVTAINASQMTVTQLLESGWHPSKTMILIEDYKNAPNIFALAKKNNLHPDITFTGLWPQNPPNSWEQHQKQSITNKIKQLHHYAAV